MSNIEALETADRFFKAIEAGEVEAIRGIYSPDAAIWHNNENAAQSVDENLRVLRWVVANIKAIKYDEIRRQPTPAGFVQQHVLRGRFRDREVAIPACVICIVERGRITRLDEYVDSAEIAIFRE